MEIRTLFEDYVESDHIPCCALGERRANSVFCLFLEAVHIVSISLS